MIWRQKKTVFLRKWTQLSFVKTLKKVQKSSVCFCEKNKKFIKNHQKIQKSVKIFEIFLIFADFLDFLPIYMSTDM